MCWKNINYQHTLHICTVIRLTRKCAACVVDCLWNSYYSITFWPEIFKWPFFTNYGLYVFCVFCGDHCCCKAPYRRGKKFRSKHRKRVLASIFCSAKRLVRKCPKPSRAALWSVNSYNVQVVPFCSLTSNTIGNRELPAPRNKSEKSLFRLLTNPINCSII